MYLHLWCYRNVQIDIVRPWMWVSCYHVPLVCACFSAVAQFHGIQGVILLLCAIVDPFAVPVFLEHDSHGLLCELLCLNYKLYITYKLTLPTLLFFLPTFQVLFTNSSMGSCITLLFLLPAFWILLTNTLMGSCVTLLFFLPTFQILLTNLSMSCCITLLFLLPCFQIIHTNSSSSSCITFLLPLVFNRIFSLCSLPLLSLKCTVCRCTLFKFWHFQKVIDHVAIMTFICYYGSLTSISKFLKFLYSRLSHQTQGQTCNLQL